MTDERFRQTEKFFHEAKVLDPADRAGFLDNVCKDDLDLRAEIESLLLHSDSQTERIELSPSGEGFNAVMVPRDSDFDGPELVDRGPVSEGPGTRIGRYKILQLIGEGGFGSVYMAEQQEPVKRKVALKIIKLGMDTKQVIARFEAERQALAMMEHPNIARVLDAGATDTGRPYFVMELVKGIPLTEYCDKNKLSTNERLDLFLEICGAVQHAHQKGIIHRDLKPSNVLITLHDSTPVPKVIDFGIAKATSHRLTDKTLFTEFRQFLGTPEYMSPDQAEISGLDVDTRTDIYSLGVLLYELLTGTTPFDSATLRRAAQGEIQRIIREVEPPKPSTRIETLAVSGSDIGKTHQADVSSLSRLMRGDLDWIVMKALEKDRTRRYQSASELAGDVRRHLNSEPVLAGPPSVIYKFTRFIRRHRVGVTAGMLIVAAILTGLSVAAAGFVEAHREALRSQRLADFLQDLLVSTHPESALAQQMDVENVMATAREIFGEDHATVAAILSSRALQLQSSGDLESAERLYREALNIWRNLRGHNDIKVGDTLSRLGVLLMTKGDDLAAEEALRESIAITRSLPGEENTTICGTLSVLATVLANRGEFESAEEHLRESLRIKRAVAPNQRLQIALNLHSIANLLELSGKSEDLKELAPQIIDAWRDALPEDSLLLARLFTEYGSLYLTHNDIEKGEPLLKEAADIFCRTDDLASPHRAIVLRSLHEIINNRRYSYSKEEYLKAQIEFVNYAREVAQSDDQVLSATLFDVILVLKGMNHPVEAVPLCREVVEMVRRFDDPAPLTEAVRNLGNLGWDIAWAPGRDQKDYRLAQFAIEDALAERPGDPAFTNSLGVVQYRLGLYEEALETLAVSDEWYSRQFEGGLAADIAFIAMAHHRLGHEKETQIAMQRLRGVMRRPDAAGNLENQAFLSEAENLIAGKESGWR